MHHCRMSKMFGVKKSNSAVLNSENLSVNNCDAIVCSVVTVVENYSFYVVKYDYFKTVILRRKVFLPTKCLVTCGHWTKEIDS